MTLTTIGSGNDPVTKGNVYVKLVKKNQRKQGVQEIMDEVRVELQHIPGANLNLSGSVSRAAAAETCYDEACAAKI